MDSITPEYLGEKPHAPPPLRLDPRQAAHAGPAVHVGILPDAPLRHIKSGPQVEELGGERGGEVGLVLLVPNHIANAEAEGSQEQHLGEAVAGGVRRLPLGELRGDDGVDGEDLSVRVCARARRAAYRGGEPRGRGR